MREVISVPSILLSIVQSFSFYFIIPSCFGSSVENRLTDKLCLQERFSESGYFGKDVSGQ